MKKKMTFLGCFILCFLSLWITSCLVSGKVFWIDQYMLDEVILNIRNSHLTSIFKVITFFASTLGVILIALISLFFIHKQRERKYFVGNLLGTVFINQLLKFIIQRPRPLLIYRLVEETGYSFPSGHSMVGTSLYTYFIYMIWKQKWSKVKKGISTFLLSCFILSIGFSRIYLGVHFTTDVIGGICFGLLFTILWIVWKEDNSKKKNLLRSLFYAKEGIISAFHSERNMRVHLAVMIAVIMSGFLFQISMIEWMICILLFGLVFSLEIMNTAIETTIDLVMPNKHPKAKLAKDLSAGAVLVAATISIIIGLMIFLPKLF